MKKNIIGSLIGIFFVFSLFAIEFNDKYNPKNRSNLNPQATGKIVNILQENESAYIDILNKAIYYKNIFEKIPRKADVNGIQPFWENVWFNGFDAISLYTLLVTNNPKFYIEIGSGNSTKFARLAITNHNLQTKIISIDPSPRANIDLICDQVIRQPLEDVDLNVFNQLSEGDIIFTDNSHRSFQNSDVTVFFTEVMPLLNSGVIYGFHDIFLPFDYMPGWEGRYYNEQYMLQTYLLGGKAGDEIILPIFYVSKYNENPSLKNAYKQLFSGLPSYIQSWGGCFWLIKN